MGVSLPWMRSKSGDGGGEVVVNKDFRRGWEGVVRPWACLAARFSHLLACLQTPLHKYQEGHDVSLFMREDLYLYTCNLNTDNNWAELLHNHLVLNSCMSFNKTERKCNLGLGWIGSPPRTFKVLFVLLANSQATFCPSSSEQTPNIRTRWKELD